MKVFLIILFSAILTDNFVLSKFLGICPFLGVSKKLNTAVSMSLAVILVMLLATAATWPVYTYILLPNGLEYLQTIAFILIIAALVQLMETLIKRFSPPLYSALGIYLPLITTNCAVLGVTTLNLTYEKTVSEALVIGGANGIGFAESLVNALGAGIGFLVAMVLFAGVRGRLEASNIPKSLRGLPITLIAASIVALSFLGFGGIVNNIFA